LADVRPIRWLHLSDLHTRVSDAWSQDAVLKAMCDDIARQRKWGMSVDFILATDDLACSGHADEYKSEWTASSRKFGVATFILAGVLPHQRMSLRVVVCLVFPSK
jgi:hypothetical protein